MPLTDTHWGKVTAAADTAVGIAWDGCHKIYVLMDEQQFALMESYGYNPLLRVSDANTALATLKEWYADSCGLRFISAVKTVDGDPNEGFIDLISQFDDEEI